MAGSCAPVNDFPVKISRSPGGHLRRPRQSDDVTDGSEFVEGRHAKPGCLFCFPEAGTD
jgi:hypothetical protein